MPKFQGVIGFSTTVETTAGVWEEQITERNYCVEIIRNTRKLTNSEQLNDNLDITNEFSILADPYARNNFHSMRYIKFMGALWKITTVEVQYPRLILNVGGVYNDGN